MPAENLQEADKAEENTPPQPVMSAGAQSVVFNELFQILPRKRLPNLDQGPVKAYQVEPVNSQDGTSYYALICERHLLPRAKNAAAIAHMRNPGLVRLVATGPLLWPLTGQAHYAFVYEHGFGEPLMADLTGDGLALPFDVVLETVIKPVVSVLQDMRDADLSHGCIRPSNMFRNKGEKLERIVLGDCLAVPPSYSQPVIMETIERSMADPIGRGIPHFDDDIYSFGVSLVLLMRSQVPMKGMGCAEIVKQKMEIGTYAALVGKERLSVHVLELLRGLLHDDRQQRWNLDDILTWMEGQRFSSKQPSKKIIANRPLVFNDKKFVRPELLALEMRKNPKEAAELIEGDSLDQWIERSIEDKALHQRYEIVQSMLSRLQKKANYEELLFTYISTALHPDAPLRCMGMCLDPEGIPYALAEMIALNKDPQPFVDLVNQQMVPFWLEFQNTAFIDSTSLIQKFENCRAALRHTNIGYGIERCLYILCEEAPCMSEFLREYLVINPEDLPLALEKISSNADRPELFIDRHIAAFLSVKERAVIDSYLSDINAPEYHLRVFGNIKCLAAMQKRFRSGPLPGMAKWISEILEPVYERFHDRHLRRNIQDKIQKFIKGGDISRIVLLLDNREMHNEDFSGFRRAMKEYRDLREEEYDLKAKMENPKNYGRTLGREVSAVFSAILSGLIIFGFAFFMFFGNF